MTQKKFLYRFTPPQIITLSFMFMILIGTLLLNLPFASKDGQSIGILNALFTATSANCVTGLVVVNTLEHWTLFGKIVIIFLIQFGGLGLISILTVGMVYLRRNISLENRIIIQASFNQNNIGGMVRLVKRIIKITFILEGIGAILLTFGFYVSSQHISFLNAFGKGIFHSISAFCNAGFDIIGPDSLTPYQGNLYINLVIMFLLVSGGIGFTVWGSVIDVYKTKKKYPIKSKWAFLSLHSKIAILVTAVLILSGLLLFLLFESNNPATIGDLPTDKKIIAALFQSVTLRTCGFNTIAQGDLTILSKILSCFYMFIGGSPASTAGGIKTVTIGVIIISMCSVLQGKRKIEAFQRSLPLELLQKSLTVITTMMIVVILSTFILFYTESTGGYDHTIMDLLFESVSAAGTVGVSTGITASLSSAGKIVITLCMFLGRLSPVTVVVALNMRLRRNGNNISYPSENIIVG